MAARKKKAEDKEQEQTRNEQKPARGGQEPAREGPDQACDEQNLTRDDIIHRYLEIYRRCMTDDPKSFDARGAAHALEQISKLLGLTVSAKDTDGNEIVLTLSEEADALGQ